MSKSRFMIGQRDDTVQITYDNGDGSTSTLELDGGEKDLRDLYGAIDCHVDIRKATGGS